MWYKSHWLEIKLNFFFTFQLFQNGYKKRKISYSSNLHYQNATPADFITFCDAFRKFCYCSDRYHCTWPQNEKKNYCKRLKTLDQTTWSSIWKFKKSHKIGKIQSNYIKFAIGRIEKFFFRLMSLFVNFTVDLRHVREVLL